MIPLLLANADASALSMGNVVSIITALLVLALTASQWVRAQTGKPNERQIEPTQLAAIQAELRTQTLTLGEINRQSATTAAHVETLRGEVATLRKEQKDESDKIYHRVNSISLEARAATTRVDEVSRRVDRMEQT